MTAERYTFLGFSVSADDAAKFVNGLMVRDERDGGHVTRMRTEEYVGVPNRRKAAA